MINKLKMTCDVLNTGEIKEENRMSMAKIVVVLYTVNNFKSTL